MVARTGIEPVTFHFSGERCYQLSYLANVEEAVEVLPQLNWSTENAYQHKSGDVNITAFATPTGLEPATSAVTGRRANQLRYGALRPLVDRFRSGLVLSCASPRQLEKISVPFCRMTNRALKPTATRGNTSGAARKPPRK